MTEDDTDFLEDIATRLYTGRMALVALRDLTAAAHPPSRPGLSNESLSSLFAVVEDYFAALQQDTEQAAHPPVPQPVITPLSLVTAQGKTATHKPG